MRGALGTSELWIHLHDRLLSQFQIGGCTRELPHTFISDILPAAATSLPVVDCLN